jgi:hypothetical protein
MITPFPFQTLLKDHLKKQTKTWKWFAEQQSDKASNEKFKDELLKNTYRLDRESEPNIYAILDAVQQKLGVATPITLYQNQNVYVENASIAYLENEAHIVFNGAVFKLLNDDELKALMAHEVTHILFYQVFHREYDIADKIIRAHSNDVSNDDAYIETGRLNSLFVELFCDIGSYFVCENAETPISVLLKMHTGLEKVNVANYLKQTEEILAKKTKKTEAETHPDIYIRAKSLALYAQKKEEAYDEISELVIGKDDLFNLNIFNKEKIYNTTRDLVQLALKPKWMQSEYALNLYRQYFKEVKLNSNILVDEKMKNEVSGGETNMCEYYAQVLVDFALCDRDAKEVACGMTLDLTEQLGIEKYLKVALKKSLNITEKEFANFSSKSVTAYNNILHSENENQYE